MAQKLKNFAWSNRRGPKSDYPWLDWMNRSIWEAVAGKDFTNAKQFRAALRAKAAKHGMSVRTEETDNGNVVFQFNAK